MPKPTYEEMYDVLSSVIDDLDVWAFSGVEGYNEDEMERREYYSEFLSVLEAALIDEKNDKIARLLAL